MCCFHTRKKAGYCPNLDANFTYEFSGKDMGIDLNSEQVDDIEVRVEALCQPLRQIFLQGHVEALILVYGFLELLQAIT